MTDFFDDDDLLSEDYKKKEDDLEDDLDEAELLYGSEDEDDEDLLQDITPQNDVDFKAQSASNESSFYEPKYSAAEAETIIITRSASAVADSDSEGTDTKDENDDGPIEHDNSGQRNVTIYRTISNPSNRFATGSNGTSTQEDNSLIGDGDVVAQRDDEANAVDDDEESDDDEKDKRNRFRSERDGKEITISSKRPSTDKRDIPDTLEISEEERQKIENFDRQEKERRLNKRNRGRGRGYNRKGSHSQPRFQLKGIRGGMLQNLNRPRYPTFKFPPFRPFLRTGTSVTQPPPPPIFSHPPLSGSSLQPSLAQRLPLQFRMMPPPPWGIPGMPPPPLAVPSSVPPPNLPVSQSFQSLPAFQQPPPFLTTSQSQPVQSSIPVLSAASRKPDNDATGCVENKGNPIPTLLSGPSRPEPVGEPIKTVDSKISREVVFGDAQRSSSPQLSVKITKARSRSRSRSRSTSSSPIPRSRKRTVLRPRRSRSPRYRRRAKSPPPKKRSRKRSRSYSPRRRSPPAHRSSSENTSSTSRTGKILINPHFKGARKLPSSAVVKKSTETPETKLPTTTASLPILTSVAPPFISVPPPPLPSQIGGLPPPPNVLIPPPPIPNILTGSKAVPPPGIPPPVPIRPLSTAPNNVLRNTAPPTSSVQMPPGIPPPGQVFSVPPPPLANLQPPPGIKAIHPTLPLPTAPVSLNHNHTSQPHMFTSNKQPRPSNAPTMRNTSVQQNEPVVHIRPVYNDSQSANSQIRLNNSSFATSLAVKNSKQNWQSFSGNKLQKPGLTTDVRMTSRLKPPPVTSKSVSRKKAWEENLTNNDDYQARLKQQAEKRKQYLESKARKRFKGGENASTKTATISIVQPAYTPYKPSGPQSVKISNLAAATKVQSVEKLMNSIGPVVSVEYSEAEKAIVGKFKSSEHAKLFAEKYNRHLLDLSCITISLVG